MATRPGQRTLEAARGNGYARQGHARDDDDTFSCINFQHTTVVLFHSIIGI